MNSETAAITVRSGRLGSLERWYQNRLYTHLRGLEHGHLTINCQGSTEQFGRLSADCDLRVELDVLDPTFFRYATLAGGLGVGEAYMDGLWRCDDLTKLIQLFVRNRDTLDQLSNGLARLSAPLLRWLHYRNRNTQRGSRQNIAAHYDLGNALFRLFLDRNMMYSSAIFRSDADTLETAADHKLERLCQKLDLQPSDHVIEIGTGWGGFAIYAAKHYGCRVTTTTISAEQFAFAQQRVRDQGLQAQIAVIQKDYRDLVGQYDKLVSIEMIEAVGHHFLDTYFAKCSELLKPQGMMALQAITIEDQRYQRARKTVDFIKRHIFPGSFIPAVSVMSDSIARSSDLRVFHLEDIGDSYAQTLRHWRQRFFAQIDKVKQLGYPERFIRMWEFYLCYCEGGFLERQISNVQMLLTKPLNRRQQILPKLETTR